MTMSSASMSSCWWRAFSMALSMNLMMARGSLHGVATWTHAALSVADHGRTGRLRLRLLPLPRRKGTAAALREHRGSVGVNAQDTSFEVATASPAVLFLTVRQISKQALTCTSTLVARATGQAVALERLRVAPSEGVGDACRVGSWFVRSCPSFSPHFSGTCFDERVAPTPGPLCATLRRVTANSPR